MRAHGKKTGAAAATAGAICSRKTFRKYPYNRAKTNNIRQFNKRLGEICGLGVSRSAKPSASTQSNRSPDPETPIETDRGPGSGHGARPMARRQGAPGEIGRHRATLRRITSLWSCEGCPTLPPLALNLRERCGSNAHRTQPESRRRRLDARPAAKDAAGPSGRAPRTMDAQVFQHNSACSVPRPAMRKAFR